MKILTKFLAEIKINKIIQFLTYSDILMLSGWGLINPILAVFFTEQIIGGSVAVAGLASTVYFLTKCVFQIPIARFIDLQKGEWDDFWIMIVGSALITLCPFMLIFAIYPWHIYAIQAINGIGGALSYPSWMAIFTRHIDKKEEGLEWSLYYTATDIGSALTAALGGFMALTFGYQNLFAIVGTLSLIGTLFLAGVTTNFKHRR